MVLEQKSIETTAESAAPGGGGGQPDLHLLHSKKMSLATRLKKQRRIRQSGSESPIPASMSNNSDGGEASNRAEDQGVHTKASEESCTSSTSATTGTSDGGQSKASSAGGSVGASLLHNKRRAMHLAKNKKGYQKQKMAMAAAAKEDEESEEPREEKKTDDTSGSHSKNNMVNATTDAYAPYLRKMPLARGKFAQEPTKEHHNVISAPSGDSDTMQDSVSPAENGEESHDQTTQTQASEVNRSEDKQDESDISDRFSQVSIGSNKARSEISNGVVAYDDSIMSIARLDNFRSKVNQDKANRKQVYPGSTGGSEAQEEKNTNTDDQLSSNTKPSEQEQPPWKSRQSNNNAQSSAQKQPSWMNRRSPIPDTTEEPSQENSEEEQYKPVATSTTAKLRSKFSHQPSWVKSPTPSTVTQNDDVPSSPTPSTYSTNTEHRQVSPARSTYSSASYRFDRGGFDHLIMPKFNSSRSDVGPQSSAVPTAIRAKRFNSSSVKSYVPQMNKQEDTRPGSPTPSWPSANDQPTCPPSPSPSQISEIESEAATDKSTEDVPKAKTWSAKKQTPSWANKRNSGTSSTLPPQKQQPPTPSWAKKTPNTTEDSQEQQKHSSMPPSGPKLRSSFGVPGRSPVPPKPATKQNQAADVSEQHQRPTSTSSASSRRHSAPSWVKPVVDDNEKPEEKKNPAPVPVATTKTWSVNKTKQPEWMKKVQGGAEEEENEKPPSSVPTTKTYPVKKQTPAWMKQSPVQADPEEDENDTQKKTVSAPSPRRHSAPSWKDNPKESRESAPVPPTPQSTGWKNQLLGRSEKHVPTSPVQNTKGNWRARSPSITEAPRKAQSPRRQSWGSNRGPSPSAEKSTIGPSVVKVKSTSDHPKVPFSPGMAKKQRCPSPSVMQLQNEIFATKLGVMDNGQEKQQPKPVEFAKAPASPAPRVIQLQEKIFSPNTDKNKRQSLDEESIDAKSTAKGWWKRIPNAPEIDTAHDEDANENEDVSSEVPSTYAKPVTPQKTGKTWKKPTPLANDPGTPSFLKDVAAFHEAASPKLPAQPPIYQQSEKPQTNEELTSKMSGSSNGKNVDESSSELMVMSSSSTTSREDVGMQQEETKSLIQMAADSVLIADYEQAMKRAALESKSYDDDESENGAAAEETLPIDLPLEFQRALTVEEGDGGIECSPEERERERIDFSEEAAPEVSHGDDSHAIQPHESVEPSQMPSSDENNSKDAAKKTSSEVEFQETDPRKKSSEVVFGDPTTYGAAGGDDIPAPRVADRAKALLGWAETRLQSPQRSEKPSVEINNGGSTGQNTASASTYDIAQNLSGIVYDENGFPCSPLVDASMPVTFENTDFSSQQWIEELGDEKKVEEDPLKYWPSDPLYELNDTSASEWVNRDPGLDMVPMHSPEPVSTGKKKFTAEMFAAGHDRQPADPALDDNWIQVSGSSRPTERTQTDQPTQQNEMQADPVGDAWGSPQQPVRQQTRANPPQPQQAVDPMWGSEHVIDATWGSPDPFAPTSISQFDMISPEERRSETKQMGDAFDPFEDDAGFMQGTAGKLFSQPTDAFAVVDSFQRTGNAPTMNDCFDTFYSPQGVPLNPVSREMEDGPSEF